MMKRNVTLIALALSAGFVSLAGNAAPISGTSSLNATFQTTVVPGTCVAKIMDSAGAEATEIKFNDVFKSDLINKSRTEAFKLDFSNCSGVKSIGVTAMPGAGGVCSTATSANFGASNNTAFEIWNGVVDDGVKLDCTTQPVQKVTLSGKSATYDMNARIVVADDKTISDVTPGDVTSQVTFTVVYQ